MAYLFDLCCGSSDARHAGSNDEDAKVFSAYGDPPRRGSNHGQTLQTGVRPSLQNPLHRHTDAAAGGEDELFNELAFENVSARFKNKRASDRYTKMLIEEQAHLDENALLLEERQIMMLDEEDKEMDILLENMEAESRALDEESRMLQASIENIEHLDSNQTSDLKRMSGLSHMTGFSNRVLDLLAEVDIPPPPSHPPPDDANVAVVPTSTTLFDQDSARMQELNVYLAMSDDETGTEVEQYGGPENHTVSQSYLQAGVNFCFQGNYLRAKKCLKICASFALHEGDETMLARALGNLANVYESTHRSAKALALYRVCIDILRKNDDFSRERFVVTNALLSCVRLHKYEEALQFAERQIEILRVLQAFPATNNVSKLNNSCSSSHPEEDIITDFTQQIQDAESVVTALQNTLRAGDDGFFYDLESHGRSLYAIETTTSIHSVN